MKKNQKQTQGFIINDPMAGDRMDVVQDGAAAPPNLNGGQQLPPPPGPRAPAAAQVPHQAPQQPRLAQPLAPPEFGADYNPLDFAVPQRELLRPTEITKAEHDAAEGVLQADFHISDLQMKLKRARHERKRRATHEKRVQIHYAAIRNGEQAVAAHGLNLLRIDFKDHTAAYRNAHVDGRCDFINRNGRKCTHVVIPGQRYCAHHISDEGRAFYN